MYGNLVLYEPPFEHVPIERICRSLAPRHFGISYIWVIVIHF